MNDLGCIIKSSMGLADVCHAINELDNGQKYKLLREHNKPGTDFNSPKTFRNGCYRSFQYRWLQKYPWLVYSKAVDGRFCKFCASFSKNRAKLDVLVNKHFTTWVKVHKKISRPCV